MKNPNDYNAGFTQPIPGPNGKILTGGAARNYRLGQIGGATGLQAQTIAAIDASITPVIDQMQHQLANQQQMMMQMMQMMKKQRRDDDLDAAFA